MNHNELYPGTMSGLIKSFTGNWNLIRQMTSRDIGSRYKGALLGIVWSLLTPLLMLAVYTFVFSTIFQSRWSELNAPTDKGTFAVILFIGLILHGLVAECLTRAPSVIIQHSNYVKKVIFPLEIFSFIVTGSALFHALIALVVFILAMITVGGGIPATIVFLPLVILPLLFVCLGTVWLMSSLGVFMRDLPMVAPIVSSVLLFVAPIFYPMSAVPKPVQKIMLLNPLTFIVEQARNVAIFGKMPDFPGLLIYTLVAVAFALIGYFWFQKTRKGFADVL